MRALERLHQAGVVEHSLNRGFRVARTGAGGFEHSEAVEDRMSRAYFRLVRDRLNGRLQDAVSARTLQQNYELSRSEVGELLERIVGEGWAARRPGYGWEFSSIVTTPEALEQSYRFRAALEPAALLEPTFHLSRDAALRARQREERLLAADLQAMPSDALYDHGVAFHELLVEASGNPFYLESIRRINRMRRLFNYQMMGDRARYPAQIQDHIRILDLVMEGRNPDSAEAMRAHLLSVPAKISVIRVAGPSLFDPSSL